MSIHVERTFVPMNIITTVRLIMTRLKPTNKLLIVMLIMGYWISAIVKTIYRVLAGTIAYS